MIKIVNFMLYIFYLDKKNFTMVGINLNPQTQEILKYNLFLCK